MKGHTRVRGAAAVLALLVPLLAVFVSCHGEQMLHSDCVDNAGVCPPCTSDEQCGIISNACTPHAYCTHRDREPPLAVTQIGCNIGYDEPPPARCGCVAGVCRAR